ncbi:quinone oxidoreductase family protein [Actinomadura rupiterrae]|uniref:quinone oxidoreductase family protein n=1 Tax=Actinomadura rupiterrae TaxID=559627 RepID=UPI0020A56624|nr:zinc-binding alcohol dehydrogenase family protein [Actinomadura rupiterrae]MCP2338954.1 putative oxidoreductase [Actinomadura rupiterrae]
MAEPAPTADVPATTADVPATTADVPLATKAVRVFRHGGPEELRYDDYPLDPLGPSDVLVRVDTASVSGWDLKYRSGGLSGARHPGRKPVVLPQQLGREASGIVVAAGAAVTRFAEGDRVVAVVHPENPYSPETLRGLGNLSGGIEIPGHQALGSYAAYLVRDENLWLPVPDGVDLEQAAVTLWPYGTSHRLLHDRLRLTLGQTLLITGASGGMGEATVRLARLMGARVAVTTRHPDKVDGLRALDPDEVVVTSDLPAAARRIREWTGGLGVDHAVDYSGDVELIRLGLDVLRLGGTLCPASGNQRQPGPLPITASDLTRLEPSVVGVRGARHRDALAALDLLARGRIRTRIAARFPLAQASEAHALLETSTDLVGRVVLKP